jgi:anti-sigma B factor antagonist
MDVSAEVIESAPNCCPACGSEVAFQPSGPAGDFRCPRCGCLLWFLRKSVDGVAILTFLPGSMCDRESVEQVDDVVSAIRSSRGAVLNLSHLRFVSAFFLGLLVRLHLRMVSAQATLTICGLRPESLEVFQVTKLDEVFSIHYNEQNALKSF